ncbi:uncharacterized protein PSFLO_01827 [Pseudozyma flocculosa]|uniref:BTB domain-containing protein n=1 Tax=Pseudozyma flocculosa TaxID=84751 RepID=A0A5C3EXL7_9BASI|nr:uncharacterized protein PSFLO_01827 [Pseudozyma flocculosa]
MASYLSSTAPFESFKVTLHHANRFLSSQAQEAFHDHAGGVVAPASLLKLEVLGGSTWSVEFAPFIAVNARAARLVDSPTLVGGETPAVEENVGGWCRHVDVRIDAILNDFRSHNHPSATASLKRSSVFFGANGLDRDFEFPASMGLFYPERTAHGFDIDFVFTLHEPGLDGVSDRASIRAFGLVTLPEATLDTIASTLNGGAWGDVCFVLKDPGSNRDFASVYGNSKLIGSRSLHLRRLIEEAGRSSVQDAIEALIDGKRSADKGLEQQRFPHEVADSDYGLVLNGSGAESPRGSQARSSTPMSPSSRFTEQDVDGGRVDCYRADPGAPSPARSHPSTGRTLAFGRFRPRKLKQQHNATLDASIDLFDLGLDEDPTTTVTRSAATSSDPLRGATPCDGIGAGQPIRYIAIRDAAFTTFSRVVLWLETDQIVFAPLSSAQQVAEDEGVASVPGLRPTPYGATMPTDSPWQTRDGFVQAYLRSHPDHPAPASAKSVYRLAETFQLTELQDLALAHICSQLRPSNVLCELFSPFTLRYPKVREMQLEYALQHWEEIKQRHPSNLDKILQQSHFLPEASRLLGRMLGMATMQVANREEQRAMPSQRHVEERSTQQAVAAANR